MCVQIMTEIAQLYNDQSDDVQSKSTKAKEKKNAEETGSKELCDASMHGLVPRERLLDITQLEGSSNREKQAQK